MLGETLRIIRVANDVSIKDLAAKIECSATYISEIEKGKRTPSLKFLGKLAATLNIPDSIIMKADELGEKNNYRCQIMLLGILRYYLNGTLDFSIEEKDQKTR